MTRLLYITSGKIIYKLPNYSLYESIYRTSLGTQFPHLSVDAEAEMELITSSLADYAPNQILSAPTPQAKETATYISHALQREIVLDNRLLPIRFDISKLMTEEDFTAEGDNAFNTLRIKFLQAFFDDELIDSQNFFKDRCDSLLRDMKLTHKEQTIIAVSHAFFIKLFMAYYLHGVKIFSDRDALFHFFNPSQAPYNRLEIEMLTL